MIGYPYYADFRRTLKIAYTVCLILLCGTSTTRAEGYNAFGMKLKTIETEHFRINYWDELERPARETGTILEELYDIYRNTYDLTLPRKTEVLVTNDKNTGSWALAILNMIHISLWDFDYYMRGTGDNLRDAVAHEYAHIVSISSSFKMPSWMPYVQGGYFSHPNNELIRERSDGTTSQVGMRLEAFHIFPSEILPPWFYEGIAQYESSRNNGDRWDSHRDMILRTLTLSGKLLSWDQMTTFAGREDDWEKTYNHGLCLIKYIDETWGYDKIVSMAREASKMPRVNFDRAVKAVLGISGRELYAQWTRSLKKKYSDQVKALGAQVYGRKISKEGFANAWPRFSPDGNKLYFLSNGESDFGIFHRTLYSYNFSDTVKEDKKIKAEMQSVNNFYDIDEHTKRIVFTSQKSRKSRIAPKRGGGRAEDIFTDELPDPAKKKKPFAPKTERQVTKKAFMAHAAFSPTGDAIACVQERCDRYYLYIVDTAGTNLRLMYPDTTDTSNFIKRIYSLDWSADGHSIAVSYVDSADRSVGIFDTASGAFLDVCRTAFDERDPRFGPDGKSLYFASDRTGIFNIYRYDMEREVLERVTNVSGGAFTPDVSADGRRLAYTNYDENGFGIYLLDSIMAIESAPLAREEALISRTPARMRPVHTQFTADRPYLRLPRQFLCIPTFISEQILTENNNSFAGVSHFKAGAVVNLNDPFDWAGMGTALGAFFLAEPGKIPRFLSFDEFLINREVTFDAGIFGYTSLLPFDVSFLYAVRGIAGEDAFRDDAIDSILTMKYNLNPRYVDMTVSHDINRMLGVHALASYNNYRVFVRIPIYDMYFPYSPARGMRAGSFVTLGSRPKDIKYNISPKGLIGKIKYEYWSQKLMNDEKSFTWDGSKLVENYDLYQYNQISADIRYAAETPWLKKHDIYTEIDITALKLTNACKERLRKSVAEGESWYDDLPPFFKPGAWVPGYVWYYRDTAEVRIKKRIADRDTFQTILVPHDTMLVSGNGVVSLGLSYRIPLYPGRTLGRKLGFLYLDKLYAALNAGGGVGYNKLTDFPDRIGETFRDLAEGFNNLSFQRTGILDDMLLYTGLELRLEAMSFSTMPLAVKARWDWGFDRPAPLGGHKFSLVVGFSFDNWDLVLEPDGRRTGPWGFGD